jgi:hypothetical protein
MREDMYKVIVERPRRGKSGSARAARQRNDPDGPTRLGMRAGYGYLRLNENLSPLRRYLHAQVGRPWNKVFAEICAQIDRRHTVQQHIHQHIRQFIAVDVGVRDGRLVDLTVPLYDDEVRQPLYVDPRTGLIRPNKGYRSWQRAAAEKRRREVAEIAARRRVLDERTMLMLLDGIWFQVVVDALPRERLIEVIADGRPQRQLAAESRYDAVLRRHVSRAVRGDGERCAQLYGARQLYAVSKRQLSSREIRVHRLR